VGAREIPLGGGGGGGGGGAGPLSSGIVGSGVAVMALPGPCLPLYAGPCAESTLCLVFEPPRDTGWPASSDTSHPLSGGAMGESLGGGGPLKFRVDVSTSHDFSTGKKNRLLYR
jgi:hypothetical protein